MTIEEAIDSVINHFVTAWDAAATGITLSYANTPLNDLPTDDSSTKQVQPKVSVEADLLDAFQVTMGSTSNRRFRRYGVMTIQILTPRGQGHLLEDRYAKIVFDSLEGECTTEGVELYKVTPLAGFNAGAYRVKQINVEFDYDEIK